MFILGFILDMEWMVWKPKYVLARLENIRSGTASLSLRKFMRWMCGLSWSTTSVPFGERWLSDVSMSFMYPVSLLACGHEPDGSGRVCIRTLCEVIVFRSYLRVPLTFLWRPVTLPLGRSIGRSNCAKDLALRVICLWVAAHFLNWICVGSSQCSTQTELKKTIAVHLRYTTPAKELWKLSALVFARIALFLHHQFQLIQSFSVELFLSRRGPESCFP